MIQQRYNIDSSTLSETSSLMAAETCGVQISIATSGATSIGLWCN